MILKPSSECLVIGQLCFVPCIDHSFLVVAIDDVNHWVFSCGEGWYKVFIEENVDELPSVGGLFGVLEFLRKDVHLLGDILGLVVHMSSDQENPSLVLAREAAISLVDYILDIFVTRHLLHIWSLLIPELELIETPATCPNYAILVINIPFGIIFPVFVWQLEPIFQVFSISLLLLISFDKLSENLLLFLSPLHLLNFRVFLLTCCIRRWFLLHYFVSIFNLSLLLGEWHV